MRVPLLRRQIDSPKPVVSDPRVCVNGFTGRPRRADEDVNLHLTTRDVRDQKGGALSIAMVIGNNLPALSGVLSALSRSPPA